MVARNPNFAKLAGGYLFPEIGRRRAQYVADHPDMAGRLISLGIGDTTLPVPPHILGGLTAGAAQLGTEEGYTGYGDVQGRTELRAKIAETLYAGLIDADEVFVSGTSVGALTQFHHHYYRCYSYNYTRLNMCIEKGRGGK